MTTQRTFGRLFSRSWRAVSRRVALWRLSTRDVRIDIIASIIETGRLGIHDISRTELDKTNSLPRFNMPLELGLFLGCKRFGGPQQKSKSCVVFDTEKYRYQKFISDIAGQDIFEHRNDRRMLIGKIRDWLGSQRRGRPLAGGKTIADAYDAFSKQLPVICERLELEENELTFGDLVTLCAAA